VAAVQKALCALIWLSCCAVQAETPALGQDLSVYLNDQARRDYLLNCAGCHRFDGKGLEKQGIPDFRGSISVFTHVPQGREYLIRVPGSAQSQLSDEALAQVLNWLVARFAPEQAPQPWQPYTAEEVARVRPQRYDDVVRERRALTETLRALGLRPATYTYGHAAPP